MNNQFKIGVMSSLLALTLSACSSQPVDEANTNAVASIPESGPLVSGNGSNVAVSTNTQTNQTDYQTDYNESTYVPAPAYNPPASTDTQAYDDSNYDANTTPVANTGSLTNAGSDTSAYDMYNNYGRPKAQPKYDYSSGSGSSSGSEGYPDIYGSGGGASSGSAGGAHAVQVLATGNSSKANSMKQQMQSLGLSAVVDNVGGLYKVRIPFASRAQATSNLGRIRSLSGESGAFVTTR